MNDIWVVNASPVIALAVIPSAADVLKALRVAGLHLDDKMVGSALEGIGETWE